MLNKKYIIFFYILTRAKYYQKRVYESRFFIKDNKKFKAKSNKDYKVKKIKNSITYDKKVEI